MPNQSAKRPATKGGFTRTLERSGRTTEGYNGGRFAGGGGGREVRHVIDGGGTKVGGGNGGVLGELSAGDGERRCR